MTYRADHTGVSVIESRWHKEGNLSIRPLFELISGVHAKNPYAFTFDMYTDKYSLQNVLKRICSDGLTRYVYLASHGNETHIKPLDGKQISRTEIKNIFTASNHAGQVIGLYLGVCSAANMNYCKSLLKDQTHLKWVAGYDREVDWLKSSSSDMMFWGEFLGLIMSHIHSGNSVNEIDAIKDVSNGLTSFASGMRNSLGFNVFYKDGGSILPLFA